MSLFEDSPEKEIERLRQIIAKMEASKGVRVVTVEMVRKENYGYLFYISAPTTADEREFGLAMAETIERSFKVIGADFKKDIGRKFNEPPSEREREIERALAGRQRAVFVYPKGAGCYAAENLLSRWMIVKAEDPGLAWSGSRWVGHRQGMPTGGVQISNWAMKPEAFRAAEKEGLRPVSQGFRTDEMSITCFQCGMTSYYEHDVRERYCGNCNVYHERAASSF